MDSVFNEYLIREVQRNPLIYDYGHENYTNAQMKQQVWEHIAEALMASGLILFLRACFLSSVVVTV